MIKCYFIEVASIRSNQPRSNFQELEIEKLADSILETDALIRPLILQDTGNEEYTVIEGHLEYYAAIRAREKNSLKAEEVNAFIIPDKAQSSAIEQLSICNSNLLATTKYLPIATTNNSIDIDLVVSKLLSEISGAVGLQTKPILDRLAKQEKVLDLLEIQQSERVISLAMQQQLQSILAQLAEHKLILDALKPSKAVKTHGVSKKLLEFRAWCEQRKDLTQLASTLNLINTLSQKELVLRMKQSAISNAEKLAHNIIDKRNTQIDRKFDTWETLIAIEGIGLGSKTIQKIIDNLK
ncbi:ParB N-terminal domain-containing protein [Chamaesiphon sp.]|uniref:ParB N-terminal domain-containing protein n=1 Tax=Chamaesiphon sp. TaxID=2814140 RepID=UPI003593EAC0